MELVAGYSYVPHKIMTVALSQQPSVTMSAMADLNIVNQKLDWDLGL